MLGLHVATCKAQADWPQFLASDQRAALTGFVQEHNGYCNAEVTSAADGTPSIFTWEGGAWLEALAAHALARLDGIEVCTGFEWAWNARCLFMSGQIPG